VPQVETHRRILIGEKRQRSLAAGDLRQAVPFGRHDILMDLIDDAGLWLARVHTLISNRTMNEMVGVVRRSAAYVTKRNTWKGSCHVTLCTASSCVLVSNSGNISTHCSSY
jgi:hypothetical protein